MAERQENLESLKLEIDEEVYRLYGISDVDRRVIEDELSEPMEVAEGETEEDTEEDSEDSDVDDSVGSLTRNLLAKQWVSYGVGIALGRFNPGLEGALGRGTFPKETAERLRSLSSQDGLMVLQKGHPDDLAQRVWEILRAPCQTDPSKSSCLAIHLDNTQCMVRRRTARGLKLGEAQSA